MYIKCCHSEISTINYYTYDIVAVDLHLIFFIVVHTLPVSLSGVSISTSGSAAISVNDIGEYVPDSEDYSNALLCRSERPSGEVSIYPNWFVDPDGTAPDIDRNNRLSVETYELYGWVRNRTIGSSDRRRAYIRRLSTALEGYFTCHINGDTNTPRGLYILYPCE